jgi:hypothetical protein
MSKLERLEKVSNIATVQKLANKILGKNNKLFISSRKDKKFMVINPYNDKLVHFGNINYEDYTMHKDSKRRDNFRSRNRKWADAEPYTPAFLSYYLLW